MSTQTARAVLVERDRDPVVNRTTAKEFLLSYPRGAYTAARTVNRTAIVDLQAHLDRFAKSMQSMRFVPPRTEVSENEMAGKEGESTEKRRDDSVRESGETGASGPDRCGNKEPPEVTEVLAPYRSADSLKQMLVPLIKIGLMRYYEIEEESSSHEAQVTALACYSFEENRPILAVHVWSLMVPNTERCRVEVYGEPRKNAGVKDSQWVRDRKVLESSMSPGFHEILLIDSRTQNIYEGLTSNFFCVMHNPDTRRPLVCSAPKRFVLEGTVMKIIDDICQRDGIDLQYWFPNVQDVDKWTGAFITSVSRLVLPVELVKFRDERPAIKLPLGDETVARIKVELQKEILNRAYQIF